MANPEKHGTSGSLPGASQDSSHAPPSKQPRALYQGLPTGTGLGKYRILEPIRRTHNATLYKARDAMLDRLVIVKQMAPELSDNPIACGHFKREAQILARIRRASENPHVVGIHELIEDDLGLFIVEEYVSGQWLESLIAKRRLDLHGAVRILKDVSLGLRTLHALSIAHRGIQPGNIVVGRGGDARITNLSAAIHESDPTPPPVIVPKYAAPELLVGPDYDDRVDIYSLGVVLFEMCVGRPALNRHFADILAKPEAADARWAEWHTDPHAALPIATDLNPMIPPRLAALIQQMTAKNLDERFASIEDVLRALSPAVGARFDHGSPQTPALPGVLRPHGEPLPRAYAHGPQPRAARSLLPSGAEAASAFQRPILQTTTQTIRLPETEQPSLGSETKRSVGPPRSTIARAGTTSPFARRSPRRLHHPSPSVTLRRPPRIRTVPPPAPTIEPVKKRHLYRRAWLVAAAVLIVLTVIGVGAMWRHYDAQSVRRPLQALVSDGIAAHEHDQLALAIEKLRKAASMDVRRSELRDLRDLAERRLILVEAEQALAQNDFASAENKLREAESRGANASIIDEIQQKLWAKKDANRLLAEGIKDLDQGNLTSVELNLDEYERKAPQAGVDPMQLRNRLELSRKDRKHAEAIDRAHSALANKDYDVALFACRDAENIKTTSETRELHKRILDLQKRAEWILRGDDALLSREFEEAAFAYEKANQIEASDKIEIRARMARAYELYLKAVKGIDKGELLAAERDLRSSLWKYPTKEARTKLAKMATAFEAARLVRKADRAMRRSDYAEAERLYAEALPNLPPPADAIVKAKLEQAKRTPTSKQARPTSAKRD